MGKGRLRKVKKAEGLSLERLWTQVYLDSDGPVQALSIVLAAFLSAQCCNMPGWGPRAFLQCWAELDRSGLKPILKRKIKDRGWFKAENSKPQSVDQICISVFLYKSQVENFFFFLHFQMVEKSQKKNGIPWHMRIIWNLVSVFTGRNPGFYHKPVVAMVTHPPQALCPLW